MVKAAEEKIKSYLKDHFKESLLSFNKNMVGGGTLNEAYRIEWNERKFFCKINSANKFPQLFEKESRNLVFLAHHSSFKIPGVTGYFETGDQQVLLMEWIEPAVQTPGFWQNFGKNLAEMHHVSQDHFGWSEDNYFGLVLQENKLHENWSSFFREQRLEPMCRLCIINGSLQQHHAVLLNKVYKKLDEIFDPASKPVLLHGDLWNGNFIAGADDLPVLIDPASYFGHNAMDLGMTTLFGGFPGSFYDSYKYYFPLQPGYRQQWKIANLYPLLVHLFLFGESYLPAISQTLWEFE